MSNPALATTDEEGARFYTWRGESFWSVTTLISGGVPKYHLPKWYAKMVAELVHGELSGRSPHSRAHAVLRSWARQGRADVERRQAAGELKTIKLAKLTDVELVLRWLKGEPERVRDAAAGLGSDVHEEAERLVLSLARETGEAWQDGRSLPDWPEELLPHMRSFTAWLERTRPIYLATEATVFNRRQAYAGTLDAIATVRRAGIPWTAVIDYKSGNRVYGEVALQLAAYRNAEFIGEAKSGLELPLPPTDGAAVLHITPKGCRLYPVDVDAAVFNAFLFAREVFRWTTELAPGVIGPEIAP